MIAHIKGTVEQVLDQAVVIDNNGLGYQVGVSNATLSRMPPKGQETKLYTHMQVKEDGLSLFGFLTQEELRIFSLLISVSGIGPKAAMAILATLTPSQIMIAIVTDDAAALSKAPGVGRKTAQRLSLELRDKIKTGDALIESNITATEVKALSSGVKQDAVDALQALGYSRGESVKAVLESAAEDMTAEQIIKQALKRLAR